MWRADHNNKCYSEKQIQRNLKKKKKLHKDILDLHVEKFHKSRKGPHTEQQKHVVPHPLLHLSFRAAVCKRSYRKTESSHSERTNLVLAILFRSLMARQIHSVLTLSHVQNGSSNLQPLVPGGHLQAVQQAHSMSSVLLCIKLCPLLIRDYKQERHGDWTHTFTLDCWWYEEITAYRVLWIPPQNTSCWGQTLVLPCNCTALEHKVIRVMDKNQLHLTLTYNDYTPESSAAHLSISAYSNSKSGDSDSPCTEGFRPVLSNYLLKYPYTSTCIHKKKKHEYIKDVLKNTKKNISQLFHNFYVNYL